MGMGERDGTDNGGEGGNDDGSGGVKKDKMRGGRRVEI